jgi:hypothetical protein
VSVLLGNGDGTFRGAVNYAAGPNPGTVVVTDVNYDGIPDLTVPDGGNNGVSVLLGNGNGSFQAPLRFDAHLAPKALVAGDFNGDGLVDLAVANSDSNDVSVLLHGALGPSAPVTSGGGASALADQWATARTDTAAPAPRAQTASAARPAVSRDDVSSGLLGEEQWVELSRAKSAEPGAVDDGWAGLIPSEEDPCEVALG